jgi:PST family polysaccharide transporter
MIIISLYTTTNVVILGFVGNQEQVGYYAAGQRLIAIFQSVITMTLSQAFFPFISRAFNESFERGLEVAQRLMPIILVFTGLVGIFFVAVAPYIVHILFGVAFEQSILVFRILAFTPLIIAFSTVAGIHVMMNLKMDNLFFKISCVGAAFSIPFNLLMAKKFGEIGSAVSLISTECLVALLFYVLLRKKDVNVINYKYFGYKSILNDVFFFRK